MHGAMWYFHEDHPTNGPGFFEKNDAFFDFRHPGPIASSQGALQVIFDLDWDRDCALWICVFRRSRRSSISCHGSNEPTPISRPFERHIKFITNILAKKTVSASECYLCHRVTFVKRGKHCATNSNADERLDVLMGQWASWPCHLWL